MTKDDRFQSLYQKYYLRVVRFFVRSFHLSEDDARDLAQDAFIRFYKAMGEYRGEAEWAFFETIARNVAYNRIRAQSAAKRSGKHVDIEDPKARVPGAPAPDYAKQQEDAIRLQQVHDAIEELPASQRQCIQMQLDGFKYREIAKFLGISDDAVKSRRRDALKNLREKLGADLLPEDDE
jgi:RNA polymerase sigma-70 factor, ECF subfamily